MNKTYLAIEQIASPIRRHHRQRETLIGLGLNRIGRVVERSDTPEIRGMIAKVRHLVRVVRLATELDRLADAVRALAATLSHLIGGAHHDLAIDCLTALLASSGNAIPLDNLQMLEHPLTAHIVDQKSASFEPEKFEDQYETALADLINQKRAGKPITQKERPRGDNVVDLMDALRKSVGGAAAAPPASKKSAKKPKATPGQKEMLMPIAGKKAAKEAAAKKQSAKPQRKSA